MRRPPSRHLLGRLGALVGVAALLAGCATTPSSTAPAAEEGSTHALSALARDDATALLARVAVPPGATRVRRAPTGSLAAEPPSRPASFDLVDQARLWRVAGAPAAVLAWVVHRLPASWELVGSGRSGVGPSPTDPSRPYRLLDLDKTFDVPIGNLPLSDRQVLVEVAPDGPSHVTLRADAQEVFIPTRPTWSFAAQLTSASASIWSNGKSRSVATSQGAALHQLRQLVNGLPMVSTAVVSCPQSSVGYRLVLTEASGRLTLTSDPCGSVVLDVRGHPRVGLVGTGLLGLVERLPSASAKAR